MHPDFFDVLAGYWQWPVLRDNLLIVLNIVGALMLGLLVGYERSYRGRAAGMRTYGLVCMASAAVLVITGYHPDWYGANGVRIDIDPGRVIQGIVTGIGFLGAGVIMRDGLNISGLTTAASIWAVSTIGILIGVGFYGAAIALTLLSTILMVWGSKIEMLLPTRHAVAVTLYFNKDYVPDEADLRQMIKKNGYAIASGSFTISRRDHQHEWRFVVVSMGKGKGGSLIGLSRTLSSLDGVASYNLSHARN